MATIGTSVPTLTDIAKSYGPDHMITTDIAELLNQTNEILYDMAWKESNLPLGHQMQMRIGLPASYYRAMNQPVPVGKSEVAPIVEGVATLEAYTQIDKEVAEVGGMDNVAKYRTSESKAQLESMNQTFIKTLIYGSTANTASFIGLSSRYGTISGASNAQNILDAGGTGGTNSSIYLVGWGTESVFGLFPKGSKAGLDHRDLGLQVYQGASGTDSSPLLMEVYRDHWIWKHGLAVKDWRYVVRIANIDIPTLLAKNGADLLDLMVRATRHIPNLRACKPAFYMNRTVAEMMDVQMRDAVQKGGQLKYEVVDGIEIPVFRGIPCRIVDQLVLNESRVV